MALSHSPRIVTDGLVLCLDAGNSAKGYNLRQNYFPRSEDITLETGGWTSAGGGSDYGGTGSIPITTANYGTAPDGTQTADRIQLDKGAGTTTEDRSGIRYNLSMVGRILSYHIKFLDSTLITDFITDVYPQGGNFTYTTLDDGWYRVEISGSSSISCRIQYVGVTTNNTLDALIWGAQLENNITTATPYTKTIGDAIDRTWYDLSGNNNNFILSGPDYTSENPSHFSFLNNQEDKIYNSSFSFGGSVTTMTVSCWVKFDNINVSSSIISYAETKSSPNPSNQYLMLYAGADSPQTVNLWFDGNRVDVNFTLISSVWYNIANVITSTSNILYLNGQQIGTNSRIGTYLEGTGYMVFGQEQDSFGGGFDTSQDLFGDLAQVSIYNRALTASEIQQNFNALRGRYGI